MCKRRAIWPQAGGKYGVKWPTCIDKPTGDICDDILPAPSGYVDDFKRYRHDTTLKMLET